MAKIKKTKKKAVARVKKKPVLGDGLDNVFRMIVLASKRAKEIQMGSKLLIETQNVHPCLISIEEIKKGKVRCKEEA